MEDLQCEVEDEEDQQCEEEDVEEQQCEEEDEEEQQSEDKEDEEEEHRRRRTCSVSECLLLQELLRFSEGFRTFST